MCDVPTDSPAGGETDYDAIILGAGISGLVGTSVLLGQGAKRVLLVDEYDRIGGNHIDVTIGDYTFDIGSLIFQDDSPLLTHFPELLPLYVEIVPTWGRLTPQGVVTRYPFSVKDDLVRAGPIEWTRIALSLLSARLFRRKIRNAKEFAEFWIGPRLLNRSGLYQYMTRFYGLPAENVDLRFAEKRMMWIKEHASLAKYLPSLPTAKVAKPNNIKNKQLARPRSGFAELYAAARQQLESRGVEFRLGQRIDLLHKKNGVFLLEANGATASARRLVSTIPLDQIQALCGHEVECNLQTVTLISLFFSFAGDRGFEDAVLYNFSHDGWWKRLTVYSDFYGRAEGREYFAVEVNADHAGGSVELAAEDFQRHTTANKLFNGDLKLEGSHTISNAYPMYTDGAGERAGAILAELRDWGIESIGRQGAFDYQPTARDTTLKAEAALRRG